MKRTRLIAGLAAICLIGALAASGASAQRFIPSAQFDLGTKAGIAAYLHSIGVDPATAVWQTGERNYAGPSCPGDEWTCAGTDRPVVQMSGKAAGANTFECTGSVTPSSSCVVVQTSQSGDNVARCVLASTAVPASQSCSITQNAKTGSNDATVTMDVSQSGGHTHSSTQSAAVTQYAVAGSNTASIVQRAFQHADTSSTGPVSQTQDATQTIEAHQRTGSSGANNLVVDQSSKMRAKASFSSSVQQRQNAAATQPNLRAGTTQVSGAGGANNATVTQKTDLQAVANQAPSPATQIQGTPEGGLWAGLHQDSSAPSVYRLIQEERQHLVANPTASQSQFGPRLCCDNIQPPGVPTDFGARSRSSSTQSGTKNQNGSSSSTFDIDQIATQSAGATAFQDDLAVGNFSSSGAGSLTQSTSQNGEVNTTECTGSTCSESLSCINGDCDAVPPDTTITSAPPAETNSTTATFVFASTEAGSTFQCSLDGSPFQACTTPKTYSGLASGSHSFAVRALDASSNPDPTPATWSWLVDAGTPTSSFDPGQNGQTYVPGDPVGDPKITGTASDALSGVAKVLVRYTSTLPGSSFVQTIEAELTCNVGATSCTWQASMPSTPGSYAAQSQAIDDAGNVEAFDETIQFTVIP